MVKEVRRQRTDGRRVDRNQRMNSAELGYWVAKNLWNNGFATGAVKSILDYGFGVLELNRIAASHLARSPASGRVMEKVGMALEGTAKQATIKWGKYEDLVWYGAVREDWAALTDR